MIAQIVHILGARAPGEASIPAISQRLTNHNKNAQPSLHSPLTSPVAMDLRDHTRYAYEVDARNSTLEGSLTCVVGRGEIIARRG
jgi:hypothetical protein